MFIDQSLALSTAQAVTVTAPSTNSFDLGSARDIGLGTELDFIVEVPSVAFTAGGAATLQIQVQVATDVAFTVPVIVSTTEAIPKASLVVGFQRFIKVPIGTNLRFVRLNYIVATGPMTAGTLSAQVILGEQLSPIYAAVQPA